MIHSLQFENFCSFRDSSRLDLTTSAKTPVDDSFTRSLTSDFVSVLTGVFGPNAAGKTNLLKPLAFLNYYIRHSFQTLEAGAVIPIDPYFDRADESTAFTLEFEGCGDLYRYELLLTQDVVLEERLLRRHPKTKAFRTLLLREAGKRVPLLSQPDNFTDLAALRELLKNRPNASMIAAGLLTGRPEFKKIDHALGGFQSNVDRMGKAETVQGNRTSELIECAKYFENNPHFKSAVNLRLKQADLGIADLVVREMEMIDSKTGQTKKVPMPFAIHKTPSGEYELPLSHESAGTKRLYILLSSFLPVLTDGGIAVIDEMESDLHPHLIPVLLNLFEDRETNPKRAQLVFTCHHVEILNHLEKEQIVLVDKDELNVSHAVRLSEMKGVRREENFFANYNAGRYEAVPEPELF